jgi:nitrous oxidase accessory protein NosD
VTQSSEADSPQHTWIVDDDKVECPTADFTTIQAAVTAAVPGDRILVCSGTYHEQVTVPKNGLTIAAKGEADNESDDEDDAPAAARDDHDVILDAHGHEFGFLVENASSVTIEGFLVERAHEADIGLASATYTTIRKNVTTAAGHDGIEVFGSNDNRIERNRSVDNLASNACGINLTGGSMRNVVRGNKLVNNEWGIQIAGATTLNNAIRENLALRNRGNGIRNVGAASGTTIEKNRAFRNGLSPGPLTGAFAAGIRVANGTGIVVRKNTAFDNLLVDLRNDAGPGATFQDNRCRTSSPPGLCERGGRHE